VGEERARGKSLKWWEAGEIVKRDSAAIVLVFKAGTFRY